MATAAGQAFFHISHTVTFAGFSGYEYFIMAISTLVIRYMGSMAENGIAGLFNLENNIHCRPVAFVAITLHTKHGRTIMTTAAGCSFFHLRHTKALVVGAGIIRLIMAVTAGVN